jgi:hypothetical protein
MTEKFGSEAEGHEPEAGHDQPSPEGEAWHGDQPPVDDFADEGHAAAEGAATVSEETETETVVEEDQTPKKSSLPILVIFVGILLAGGMIYFQFFGGSALLSKAPAPVANAVPPHKQPPVLPVASAPPAPPAAIPTPGVPPTPSVAANDISNLKPPSAAPVPAVGSAPSGVAMPSPMPSPEQPLSAPPSAIPSMPMSGGGLETQINSLSTRIDALQKSLDQAGQQLGQLNGMVTALQAAPSASPAMASLEDRLNKIEQDVMKLQQAPMAMAKPLPVPAAAIKPPHHTKPKAVTPVNAKPAPRPAAKPILAATPTSAPLAWVLRAATPGEAWVSQGANSSELKHIRVGDDLSGVGQVTAIRQDGGRWTIEGTKGSLQ